MRLRQRWSRLLDRVLDRQYEVRVSSGYRLPFGNDFTAAESCFVWRLIVNKGDKVTLYRNGEPISSSHEDPVIS